MSTYADVLDELRAAEQWWNADEVDEPDVRRLFARCREEVERLRAEAAHLAATACEKPESDERGHSFCGRVVDLENALHRVIDAPDVRVARQIAMDAVGVVPQIENARGGAPAYPVCPVCDQPGPPQPGGGSA